MGTGLRDIHPVALLLPAAVVLLLLPAATHHGTERFIGLKKHEGRLYLCDAVQPRHSGACDAVAGQRAGIFRFLPASGVSVRSIFVFSWTIHVITSPNTVTGHLQQACEVPQRAWVMLFPPPRESLWCLLFWYVTLLCPTPSFFGPNGSSITETVSCFADGAKAGRPRRCFRIVPSQYPQSTDVCPRSRQSNFDSRDLVGMYGTSLYLAIGVSEYVVEP